jgi:hypothetical protein
VGVIYGAIFVTALPYLLPQVLGVLPAAAPVAVSEFVQFSPSDELRVSEAAMARNMQQMQCA